MLEETSEEKDLIYQECAYLGERFSAYSKPRNFQEE